MPPMDELTSYAFKLFVGGLVTFMWWGKKEDKKLLDSHTVDITRLKSEAVTEHQVREIITEVISNTMDPVHTQMRDIKQLLEKNTELFERVQIGVAKQEGYQQALAEMKNREK